MRIPSAIITGMALAVVLSSCGSGGDSDSPAGPNRPPPKVASLGPFVGECGHVTDDEVRELAGLSQIARVYKNSTGCNWQSAGLFAPSVTFASYRGSPIEREKAWVSSVGRNPESIDVAGRPGFQALDPQGTVCDFAVQLDDDFFEWSISTGTFATGGNPCDRTRKLAELTVGRLG
ncbi:MULTISPECIES: DUF3558 domain-containing protein [Nocardia]|uniref:Uncharacterized protein DUF3558 n=2 Tax=Nocardia TaxID=1817 RepID=A0A4R6PWD4_NOCIG|nr:MULTISPECIES: DUF3558 domain-containing protein [Nocardia]NKX87960.1 DUF3558 domain-containing protein [Nocardia coubleae]TDP42687.1 uncharacterized protein DUF3558 [Nocardia ignorata]